MRIQKYLAACGVGSRRGVERLIEQGRIRVNGQPAGIGQDVSEDDRLEVDGRPVRPAPVVASLFMLNKPIGYVTTVQDPQRRPTVMDLLPPHLPRVYPVGRLDRDSHGLLLFTNDGALTHQLLHPSRGVWKRYLASVAQPLAPEVLERLRRGVVLDDGLTAPCKISTQGLSVTVELKEGRKRQVRRMLALVGHPVLDLQRIAFGSVELGKLALGQLRALTPSEEKQLRNSIQDREEGLRRGQIKPNGPNSPGDH